MRRRERKRGNTHASPLFSHLLLLAHVTEPRRQDHLLLPHSGQQLVSLHTRGGRGVAHLEEDDAKAVHVHFLGRRGENRKMLLIT